MAGYDLNTDMERQAVRSMFADPTVLPKIARHVKPAGFSDPLVRLLVEGALRYHKATGAAPTAVGALQEVRNEVTAGRLPIARVTECAELLEEAAALPPVAGTYVVDRVLTVERHTALREALETGMKKWAAGKRDEILPAVEKAHNLGRVDESPGLDLARDIDVRTDRRLKHGGRRAWGTGIVDLDDLLKGGLSLDNPQGLVWAAPKGGKSLLLVQASLHVAMRGGLAVNFTMEMGAGEWMDRLDSAISMVPYDDLYARAEEVRDKVRRFSASCRGAVHVKDMPGGGKTSVRDCETYLEQWRMETGAAPSMINVDYPDLMRPNDPAKYEKRHEELNAILEEHRDLLRRWKAVGWAPSQMKADALEKKRPAISDAAGAFAKAFTADVIVAILRTEEEKRDNLVRLAVVGGRFCPEAETAQLPSAYSMGRIVLDGLPT
jgi:hypothetical protein